MGMRQELFARRKDTTEVPVEIELSYVDTQAGLLVMAFIVDITERKERERQLLYHASLQENVTDAVIATDLDFRIKSWNRAAEAIYGWKKEEVIGRPLNTILETKYANDAAENRVIQEFLEHGYWTDEVIQYHRTGSVINLLSSVVLFKDEEDRPVGIVAVNHDITNRKKAEQVVHQALVKEKELSELKTRFISMASHEFRTPLASILALTETLMAYRHKLSEEQIDQRFGKIKEQVDYLKDIMGDVLLLGRMQTRRVEFNPGLVDLHALCRSVLEEFQTHPAVPHQLVYVPQGLVRDVSVDKKLMRHVINNLVGNAIKYSPQNKAIIVTLTITETALMLEVRDEGIGIPDVDLKHLFEPFHRATNVGTISGTGLGLVITKEAVDFHNGTITVASEVNVGTTFTVTIPLSP
jgi:PAS domain S-box-containing protein